MKKITLSTLATLLLLAGCEERGDTVLTADPIKTEEADSFLRYINTQASLGAGDYTVAIATANPGESDSYTLSITFDDGSRKTFSGSWSGSAGQDSDCLNTPCESFTLERAGGIKIALTSSADNYLYLLNHNGAVIKEDDNSGSGNNALIDLPLSQIDDAAYTKAYYDLIDPLNERDTLAKWKTKNGFDGGADVHVIFRDTKDLGYGRDMYARKNADGTIAFYVNNFFVTLIPGSSENYGPLNLDAAIDQNWDYQLGSNAIEVSPNPLDPSENIVKFFTFTPSSTGNPAEQQRLSAVNLDGRGAKGMPGPCIVCHGGRLLPLDPDGNFQPLSLRSAKLNRLEVNTFEFSSEQGFTQSELEPLLKVINQYVHDSYPTSPASGDWQSDSAIDIAAGRYGGAGFPNDTYNDYIPDGWKADISRPDGVELLYSRVVEPHCIGCHSLRGTTLQSDINFSTYEKFISHEDQIIEYVFRRGQMPLALLNYRTFWEDPDDVPTILASFLPSFDLYDANGKVRQPGRPIANAGEDMTIESPVQLSASASSYAASYLWEIIAEPPGSDAVLSAPTSEFTKLTTSVDGSYTLRLTASNQLGSSTDELELMVDNSLAPGQAELTFKDDIVPLLQLDNAARPQPAACITCHASTGDGGVSGIPVFYTGDVNNSAELDKLYIDVMARVNLTYPEYSKILRKPTGNHHFGGLRFNVGDDDYNTILSWIRAGATKE